MKKLFPAVILLLVLFVGNLLSNPAFSQAGSNDATFNPTDIGFGNGDGANGAIQATAVQSDGKVIVGGDFFFFNSMAINRVARLNSNGSLDATFNTGTGAGNTVYSVALQSDGKIIIAGSFSSYNAVSSRGVARLNSDGSIDATFIPGTGANGTVNKTAIQSDGKIIIAGQFTSYNGTATNNIARLNPDGSLDATFNPGTGANGTINATALQTDGKLIIAGQFTIFNGTARNYIARLKTDGSLDATFNPGTGADNFIYAVSIQSDGRIVIGGDFSFYNGTGRNFIARLNSDGTLDATFNPGAGANNPLRAIAIQADGKIIFGGAFTDYNGNAISGIGRINSDGTFDATFNPGTGTNSTVQTASIQPDGKIIIGGLFIVYNGKVINRITRVNGDGTLDGTFNPVTGSNSTVVSSAIQSDGKIIIAGAFTVYNGAIANSIARLNNDGSIDATFTPGAGANNFIQDIALQSDGKIIIGGAFTSYNGTSINRIARLNSDGTLDGSFNPGSGATSTVFSISLQSDGKIVIGGLFFMYNGTARSRIARINSDGSLDATFNPGTGANNNVTTTAVLSTGKVLIGGSFTAYNGTARNYIAQLNSNGTLDATFNQGTGTTSFVNCISEQADGKIIIAGTFSSYNGTAVGRIARLNNNGSIDASFTPGTGANSTILTTAIQSDGKIIIGGDFNLYTGAVRNNLARINMDGTLDVSFSPNPGGNLSVRTSAIQSDGNIIIGGAFTAYDGTGRNRLVRVLGGFTAVPLRLISFTGKIAGSNNHLQWQTDSEHNSKEFVVEKSSTGSNFTGIATVAARGTGAGTYACIDNVQTGIAFYRLKMIDVDGRFTYSSIIKLNANNAVPVSLFPNPVKDVTTVTVHSSLLNKNAVLTNMQGATLEQIKINAQSFTVDLTAYPAGVYLLKVEGAALQKIVKE